jgi:hypothetical protein
MVMANSGMSAWFSALEMSAFAVLKHWGIIRTIAVNGGSPVAPYSRFALKRFFLVA